MGNRSIAWLKSNYWLASWLHWSNSTATAQSMHISRALLGLKIVARSLLTLYQLHHLQMVWVCYQSSIHLSKENRPINLTPEKQHERSLPFKVSTGFTSFMFSRGCTSRGPVLHTRQKRLRISPALQKLLKHSDRTFHVTIPKNFWKCSWYAIFQSKSCLWHWLRAVWKAGVNPNAQSWSQTSGYPSPHPSQCLQLRAF